MRAAILSIGSELVHGFLTDTNATFLTQELQALGIHVTTVTQVGDDFDRLVLVLRRAIEDADLIITTGGIGPTEDDLTREAIAEVAGEQVEVDAGAAERIREFFTMRGVVMPEQNVKQAWVIPSTTPLANPMGTAPGWFTQLDDRMIVTMPGVPREMYRMWREQAVPRILERLNEHAIVSRTLKTIGIGESAVEGEILDLVHRGDPVIATYAKDDGVHIRITALADQRAVAETAVNAAEGEIRARIGQYVYGYLDDSLAACILKPLRAADRQLVVVEIGNAGRFTTELFETAEAATVVLPSTVMAFDEVAHSNVELSELVRNRCRSDDGAQGSAAIVVATRIQSATNSDRAQGSFAIAFRIDDQVRVREQSISAVPHEIRRRATMSALDFVWRTLPELLSPAMD